MFSIVSENTAVQRRGKEINNPENLFAIIDDAIDATIPNTANGITILYASISSLNFFLVYIAVPSADAMSNHPESKADPIIDIKSEFRKVDEVANAQAT